MAQRPRKYWLLKSEPTSYSFTDLERDGSTDWTGVRNYQARNSIRDDMQPGDGVLFYHSGGESSIVGIAEIDSKPHLDETALDPNDDHYDPKSTPENPIWMSVTVKFKKKLKQPITLADAKKIHGLEKMVLLQKGSRLSVQPVSEAEWNVIVANK